MKIFKLFFLILNTLFFCVSCKKDCVNELNVNTTFDIEILNRQDTINMSDSIIFYSVIQADNYDLESGMHYNLNDIHMILLTGINIIDDTNNYSSFCLDCYFDYKVEIGENSIDTTGLAPYDKTGIIPFKSNDSIYYKFILYPKQSGFFALNSLMYFSSDEIYGHNHKNGYILSRENDCILLGNSAVFVPSKIQGEIDNNNFEMYRNSIFFNPGNTDTSDLEKLRNIYRFFYYVYVE